MRASAGPRMCGRWLRMCGRWLRLCCLLFDVGCLLIAICCVQFAVCCLLFALRYSLFAVCILPSAVCYLLFAVWCLLFAMAIHCLILLLLLLFATCCLSLRFPWEMWSWFPLEIWNRFLGKCGPISSRNMEPNSLGNLGQMPMLGWICRIPSFSRNPGTPDFLKVMLFPGLIKTELRKSG